MAIQTKISMLTYNISNFNGSNAGLTVAKLRYYCTSRGNPETNTSTLEIGIQIYFEGSQASYGIEPSTYYGTPYIMVDGVKYTFSIPKTNITVKTWTNIATINVKETFQHDTTGNKSIILSGYTSFNLITGSDSYAPNSWSLGEGTLPLVKINRVSTITCSTAYIGEAAKISISRPVSDFTDTITYTFNGLTGTIATKTSATSIDWTIPDSFYAKIPNVTSGKGTLTVQTFDASGTSMGTKSISFTVLVKEETSKPLLNPTVEDSNDVTYALTGDRNTMIRYFSVPVFYTGAEARNSSTLITEYCKHGDTVIESATGEFKEAMNEDFTFVAIDSRGFSTDLVVKKTFIEYTKITCNLANNKPNPDGELEIMVDGKFFDGHFGATSNSLTAEYRIKEKDAAEFGPWTPMSVMMSTAELSYSAYALVTGLDYRTTYVYEARATDKLMSAVSVQRVVKATPVFDWGEEEINFNVPISMYDRPTIHRDEETDVLTISTDTSMNIEAPDGFTVEGYNLLGLMKSMARRYELPLAMVTPGTNYSNVDVSLYLYGNVVRGYMTATRKSNATAGNMANEVMATIKFIHDGKMTGFGTTSFCSAPTGPVATFAMADTSINNRSGGFTINFAATATATNTWSTYFTFPALLNFDAFMDDFVPEADTDDGSGGTSQEIITGMITNIARFSNGKIASIDIDGVYHPMSASATVSNPEGIELATGLAITAEVTDGYITHYEYSSVQPITVYVKEGVTTATAGAYYHATDECDAFVRNNLTPIPLTFNSEEDIPSDWNACTECHTS